MWSPKIHKSGNLRGEKITYKDGTGCCIWTPFKTDESKKEDKEEPGVCFDFNASDLEDLKVLSEILLLAEPDVFVPDPEEEKREEKLKKESQTWWYKVMNWLEDIHIGISPFEWRFTTFMVTRPTNHKRMLMFQWCKGFILGPIRVCWH
jgi:hypothetical protein